MDALGDLRVRRSGNPHSCTSGVIRHAARFSVWLRRRQVRLLILLYLTPLYAEARNERVDGVRLY